jgi:hypothetical protein
MRPHLLASCLEQGAAVSTEVMLIAWTRAAASCICTSTADFGPSAPLSAISSRALACPFAYALPPSPVARPFVPTRTKFACGNAHYTVCCDVDASIAGAGRSVCRASAPQQSPAPLARVASRSVPRGGAAGGTWRPRWVRRPRKTTCACWRDAAPAGSIGVAGGISESCGS